LKLNQLKSYFSPVVLDVVYFICSFSIGLIWNKKRDNLLILINMLSYKNWHEKHFDTLGFGSRLADSVAKGMGSWKFIIIQTILVLLWMGLNLVGYFYHWDINFGDSI